MSLFIYTGHVYTAHEAVDFGAYRCIVQTKRNIPCTVYIKIQCMHILYTAHEAVDFCMYLYK